MFDVKYRTQTNNQKDTIESIDYEKQIIDLNIDVKPFINGEIQKTCEPLNNCNTNQTETFETSNDWYNDDIYYMKSFEVLTPSSMDQIIATTIKDDMIDSGFENSPISINNCDEIHNLMLTNLVNDLEPKQEINKTFIQNNENNFETIKNTDLCQTENGN